MNLAASTRFRVTSIDFVRGLVMVIMALDHVRDYFFRVPSDEAAAYALGPTDPGTTTPALFFTRWITHFCAPAFVLLTGTAAYLNGAKKSKNELSKYLLTRGIFLVLLEIFIVTLGWTFNPFYNVVILQVIWAIGISMIIMAAVVQLPYKAILVIGLLMIFGHNLMDIPSVSAPVKGGPVADLLYFSNFAYYELFKNHGVVIVYAFLPWTGLMMLGYCLGKYYENKVDPATRRKFLMNLGLAMILLFILLRFINVYGDPVPWSKQSRGVFYTFLSFLNTNKYPPSLLFLLMTLGPIMIILAQAESWGGKLAAVLKMYGRVPLFYYILHFYIIHTIVVIVFYMQGFEKKDIAGENNLFLFCPPEFGFGLLGVYLVWITVVLILYPLCKWYDRYKSTHKKWWLKYI